MSEARKLTEPDLGLDDARAKDVTPAAAVEANVAEANAAAADAQADLSGLTATLRTATATNAPKAVTSEPAKPLRAPLLDRASNALMVLFVTGFLAFAAGIAAAVTVVTGMLDLQTGWVKDMLKTGKELFKQLSSG